MNRRRDGTSDAAMTRTYRTFMTLTLGDEEEDVPVRGSVTFEFSRSGERFACLDGVAEVFVGGEWIEAFPPTVTREDMERIDECLCEMGLEDDRDYCGRADEDSRFEDEL